LVRAWALVTKAQRQSDWALALLVGRLTLPAAHWSEETDQWVRPAEVEELLLALIPRAAEFADPPPPWQQVLFSLSQSWTTRVFRRVVHVLRKTLLDPAEGGSSKLSSAMRTFVLELAFQVADAHQADLEHCLQALVDAEAEPHERLQWAVEWLRFVRQLRESLTEPPAANDGRS
jgi:hypothetical protein